MPRKSNTRAAQGAGTIRQRPDGRWEGRCTVGRDPGTGKQIQRSVYGRTQKEVRQKLAQLTVSVDNGLYKAPCALSVGQWFEIWEREYLGDVKQSTAESYHYDIQANILPALGAVKLEALTAPIIQHFYNSLSKEREGGKRPMAPATVRHLHNILHRALKQAVAVGYLRSNPADACTLPRIVKREITPMDAQQIRAFLAAVQGHQFETLFKAALFTGMRQGELLGLMWDSVDFQAGVIVVRRQLCREQRPGGVQYLSTPKSNNSRTICPAPSVMHLLKAHKAEQARQRLAMGSRWEDQGLVFPDELGGFLSEKRVYERFKAVVKGMGLPALRFHDLRHSYAVAAIQAGDDIKTIQGNLGHYSAAFTLDVYGHVTDSMRQASSDRMERFIESVTNL